jgi:hypothetical protein
MHVYAHLGQQIPSLARVSGVQRLTNAEKYKLIQVAEAVGADPDLLAAVISLETGATFDPSIPNQACLRRTGDLNRCATGLIQFTPDTAKMLGTSPADLRSMNICRQLDFVQKFYERVTRGRGIRVRGDEYVAPFAPEFLGRPDDVEIYRQGQLEYDRNRGLDLDSDGVITVGELRQNVFRRVPGGERITVTPEPCVGESRGVDRGLLPILLIAGAGVALFWGTLQQRILGR